jgi:diguanylate cyclase (GGDEF)-like protein
MSDMSAGPGGAGRQPERSLALRTWLLTAVMVLAGAQIAQLQPQGFLADELPLHLTWWQLALGFGAAEILVVHYQFRRQRFAFTLMELPLVLGLFFSTWPQLLAARLLGGGVVLGFVRRQPVRKLAFNLAAFVLEIAVAVAVFRFLADGLDERSVAVSGAAFVAVLAGTAVSTLCVALLAVVGDVVIDRRDLRRVLVASAVVTATNLCLGLGAVAVSWSSTGAAWSLIAVAVVLFFGYRSYASLQQKHENLVLLYEFTRRTGRALQVDAAMRELLGQVRGVLRCDTAAIVVRSSTGTGSLIRTSMGPDEALEMAPTVEDHLWNRIEVLDRPLLAAAPLRDIVLAGELASYGVKDALVAPLRLGDGETLGMMVAGGRVGDERTFTVDDLKLFEALANHASVSLENRHLIERLRSEAADKEHQALHDSLTGLPNRRLFEQRLAQALEASEEDETEVAVMLLDLDRFKEVNDTLGHHNGDLLLQEIAERLRRIMRAGDSVARFGGDEFALLVPNLAGCDAAIAAADGIRLALERSFTIAGVDLDVGCSIGVALSPAHGADARQLLQRADVAMYSAKSSQRGVDLYDPASDTYSLERLALVAELRTAIERSQLAVHFQPKADAVTGELLGMEALVRWHHPRQGPVPPEEIIAIAEQTGLIRPLTLWVLEQALRECRTWRRAGWRFDVAVNLSIRSLHDAELAGDVQRLLAQVGLPANALTFEITESSIMSDPVRSLAVLDRLRGMGIRLAIDDFGTGYSSFSHLRRLPVDEIKIDKSFVQHLATDESDLVLVRSIIDLGRNLGLHVVAEGVEDDATWEKLTQCGCDVVQGYILTPPLAATDLPAWLVGYRTGTDAGAESERAAVGAVVPLRNPLLRQS